MGNKKHSLFTYGTLRVPEIFEMVTGASFLGEDASLCDYKCFCVSNQLYPGLIASSNNVVDGTLYRGLDEELLSRLDNYEGCEYERVKVTVSLGKESISAWTYLFKEEKESRLEAIEWSYSYFLKNSYECYMRNL